jgi:hypothetical protein
MLCLALSMGPLRRTRLLDWDQVDRDLVLLVHQQLFRLV